MNRAKERRKYRRFRVALPIDCSGIQFFQARDSQNLSEGGIFIQTKLIEKLGVKVEIVFIFKEDWETIKVFGEVAWTGKINDEQDSRISSSGMGIKFIDPPDDFTKRIKRLYLRPLL